MILWRIFLYFQSYSFDQNIESCLVCAPPEKLPLFLQNYDDICFVGAPSNFLSPDPDGVMLNPGTFPGPPCVNLAVCDITTKPELLPPASTTTVTTVFDSITTMRMDASVTTTHSRLPAANGAAMSASSTTSLHNTPFSPPSRACATPDKTPSSGQNSPPKRPRSASINTTPCSSGSLKRTASVMSEDSGIEELGSNCKRSPIRRSKSKDKSKGPQRNVLLTQLLSSKNSEEVNVAFTGGSNNSKNISATTSSIKSTTSNTSTLASSLPPNSLASLSLPNHAPGSKIPAQTGSSFPSINRSPLTSSQTNPSQPSNPSAEISPDEREALDEIFNCYESIISSTPHQPGCGGTNFPQQPNIETSQFSATNSTAVQVSFKNIRIFDGSKN